MTRTWRCSVYLWLLSKVRSFHSWQNFSAFGSNARLEKRRGVNTIAIRICACRSGRKHFIGKGRKTFERQYCYKRLTGEWGTLSHSQSPKPHVLEIFLVLFPRLSLHPWSIISSSVGFWGAFCVFWPVSPVPVSPNSAVVPDEAQLAHCPTPTAQEVPAPTPQSGSQGSPVPCLMFLSPVFSQE